jgi:outer membrane receptor protein involved in Fe transport
MTPHAVARRAKGTSPFACTLVLIVVVAGPGHAQTETGLIAGSVRDPTGTVVAGAAVHVRSTATGVERTTTSTGAGVYTVPSLQPGVYDVTVDADGFARAVRSIAISAGGRVGLDVELSVAGAASAVDVVAAEQCLRPNTENQQVSTTIGEKEVRELPNLDRSVYALVKLAPNVADAGAGGRGLGVAINGQRAASINVLLDGGANNNEFAGRPLQNVPLDAVQEVTIITSNFSVEFGRASGGIFSVATKTGANEAHGTLYEFNRVSVLAAQDFATNAIVLGSDSPIKKDVFTKNQFGVSIGGPVVKDKILFFANIEWARTRSVGTSEFFVPTPELIAASAPATRAYFRGQELISPASDYIVHVSDFEDLEAGAFQDLGPDFPAFARVFVEAPIDVGAGPPSNVFLMVNRVDWNVSDRTSVYGRFAFESVDRFQGRRVVPYKGYAAHSMLLNYNALVSATVAFTDRFVTQTKLTVNRRRISTPFGEQPIRPRIDGGFGFGGVGVGLPGYYDTVQNGTENLVQVYEDASFVFGRHQLRFGGSLNRILDNISTGLGQVGHQDLGLNTTESLNNFVLGRSLSFTVAIDPKGHFPLERAELPYSQPSFTRANGYDEFALYATDSWKPHQRLTVNAGVRYEYFDVQHNTDRSLDSNFYLGDGANEAERIHYGQVLRAQDSPISGLVRPDRNNFGPRAGVAWDVFGDGRTSFRGGYGISYERNFGAVTYDILFNPPAYGIASTTAFELGLPFLPLYRDNLGPFTGTGSITLPKLNLTALRTDLHTAFAHFWSVSSERQLFSKTLAAIDYTGSKGVGLYDITDVNRPFSGAVYLGLPGPGQVGVDLDNRFARLNRQYGAIYLRGNGGGSIYHAMTLRLRSRDLAKSGLFLDANYTWAHAIDNLSDTASQTQRFLGYPDSFDPAAERGNASFDIRHRLVMSGVWDIPFASDVDGWAGRALDGWSFAFNLTARTGLPFNIYDCTYSPFGYVCPRVSLTAPIPTSGEGDPPPVDAEHDPNYVFASNTFMYLDLLPLRASGSVGYYHNPLTSQFVQNLFGDPSLLDSTYGPYPANMAPRNYFRGPGEWNLDASILKRVAVTEKLRLELRVELFNLFNHANLYVGDTQYLEGSTFVPAYRSGHRTVQMGVKLLF